MLISSLSLSKTHWCFSIRRLSLVTSCSIINPQFYTGHSSNFLRVKNETMAEKRPRLSLGFYKCISEFPAISCKRNCEREPEVLGTQFEAERIVAKKFVKGKPQYMVKWFNFCASENTWEQKDHLPLDLVEAFENPDPDPVRVEKAIERIGLVFAPPPTPQRDASPSSIQSATTW